ncbi:polysaccharide deacetylase family protein [Novipirellula artificiosorum]|uniref:Uncharacterized protein n=1 Tax=Novipirellula artificiosorum TaxID=2528016 RepID=A0A5C6E246_9BACT|nr:hypothetical protein [Novipirellula artificiosorum]TWU42047.1 hypothetical protein Poly41_03430 [Novipirellula artificiosorum]
MATSPLLIILHDVAAPFLDDVETIIAMLRPLVDSRFACAVVPHWHAAEPALDPRPLRDAIDISDEWLLHGWTHFRSRRTGLILTRGIAEVFWRSIAMQTIIARSSSRPRCILNYPYTVGWRFNASKRLQSSRHEIVFAGCWPRPGSHRMCFTWPKHRFATTTIIPSPGTC